MIKVQGLSHHIGRAEILAGVELEVPKGKITALIGPNGAGKSTLLSLIARLMPVQAGAIRVDGMDVTQTATRDLAQVMAVLPQNPVVASRLRVAELVGFGRWPYHQGRPAPDDHARVAEALAMFALTPLAASFLDEVSGGQRQRAHLAMAFTQGTDWLLLDEPLAALDMAHARALMLRLAHLRDLGRSTLMVLHDINFAAAWADHIVAMKAGRIVAEGSPAEVLTPAVLEALYDTPLRVEWFEGRPLVLYHL